MKFKKDKILKIKAKDMQMFLLLDKYISNDNYDYDYNYDKIVDLRMNVCESLDFCSVTYSVVTAQFICSFEKFIKKNISQCNLKLGQC